MALLLAVSCVREDMPASQQEPLQEASLLAKKSVNAADDALTGSLALLLDEKTAEELLAGQSVAALTEACAATGADMQMMFPYNGTEMERKYQMHRWYMINFSDEMNVKEVASVFAALDAVSAVEYNKPIERMEDMDPIPWVEGDNSVSPALPFNDPKLIDQWHYVNNADLSVASTARVGADVNVLNAWTLTTGDPEIIVAVCDEAVQYNHPDLADNMWVNEKELNGKEGVDDDGNGYVDDIYGYNFLSTYNPQTGEGELMPINWTREGDSGHGTHVAGTIAAVNNNGRGVSGIAGGNGTPGSGVKIMSCQLFSGNANCGTLNRARAYRYAADNGASILQCSFGQSAGIVTSDSSFVRSYRAEATALDYFKAKRANNSPVEGNIAIFASGNDGQNISGYPAAFNKYISVSAFGPDYLPTSYTNYGPGTNISAPGGDYTINSSSATPERAMILSTLPKEAANAEYGYMQGTSMACPHVSGVVALALSYAKKLGKTFSYDEFLGMIYSSVNNLDYYIETCTKYNNGILMDLTPFWHNMGTGAIDAWRLLMQIEGTPCLGVQKGVESKISLDQYFSPASGHLTYTKIEVSEEAREALDIKGEPYVKYGKLYIHCGKEGSAKISISAIAGGDHASSPEGNDMGGTEFTREVSILSRAAGYAENGGWL